MVKMVLEFSMKRDKVGQVEKGVSEISNRNQVEQEENVAERPTQFERSSLGDEPTRKSAPQQLSHS